MSQPTTPASWYDTLACPVCKGPLRVGSAELLCQGTDCAARFPIVDGIPVLINEVSSVFAISDFLAKRATTFVESDPTTGLKRPSLLRRLIPSNSRSVSAGGDERFCVGEKMDAPLSDRELIADYRGLDSL